MSKAPNTRSHYPNLWVGRALIIGLLVLVLALLAFAFLRPRSEAGAERVGEASVTRMDAAQQKADDQRSSDRRLPAP
jgi:hypothetical protein